jgi:hypothetical protein
MQSFNWEIRPMGFATKSGEFIEFNIIYNGENLVKDFEIFEGFTIPRGKYWFLRYEIQANTFRGKSPYFAFVVNWGDFFNGKNTRYIAGSNWNINRHISFNADFQRNIVSLPIGNFSVNEIGARLNLALSAKLFGSIFAQWNDRDNQILLNFRMNWIPKPGADLFFILNHVAETFEKSWSRKYLTIQLKFVWRFTI